LAGSVEQRGLSKAGRHPKDTSVSQQGVATLTATSGCAALAAMHLDEAFIRTGREQPAMPPERKIFEE